MINKILNIKVCFDGPCEVDWVENLNTMLDNSRLLCLGNSERLRVPKTLKVIFECATLENASPATISRSGIIWIEENIISYLDLF